MCVYVCVCTASASDCTRSTGKNNNRSDITCLLLCCVHAGERVSDSSAEESEEDEQNESEEGEEESVSTDEGEEQGDEYECGMKLEQLGGVQQSQAQKQVGKERKGGKEEKQAKKGGEERQQPNGEEQREGKQCAKKAAGAAKPKGR